MLKTAQKQKSFTRIENRFGTDRKIKTAANTEFNTLTAREEVQSSLVCDTPLLRSSGLESEREVKLSKYPALINSQKVFVKDVKFTDISVPVYGETMRSSQAQKAMILEYYNHKRKSSMASKVGGPLPKGTFNNIKSHKNHPG